MKVYLKRVMYASVSMVIICLHAQAGNHKLSDLGFDMEGVKELVTKWIDARGLNDAYNTEQKDLDYLQGLIDNIELVNNKINKAGSEAEKYKAALEGLGDFSTKDFPNKEDYIGIELGAEPGDTFTMP